MNNQDVIKALAQVPTTNLRIVAIAEELMTAEGYIDQNRAMERMPELEEARAQAERYAAATNQLLRDLQCSLNKDPFY